MAQNGTLDKERPDAARRRSPLTQIKGHRSDFSQKGTICHAEIRRKLSKRKHIAFVAMSGVRVCDEELLKLGFTLPGFVERSKAIASLPSLGLLTLIGMTPADRFGRTYVEVPSLAELPDLPGPFDLVAISCLTARIRDAYELAARFRAAGAKVAIGGLHVTALPEEAARHADVIVIGEGESVWPELLEDLSRDTLKTAYDARERPFDLADSPMPAFEVLDLERYNRITVQTTRGCPLKCSFCASSILLTPKYKRKPAEKVLAEIDRIRELRRKPFIELADDNSFVDKRYWRALLPELAKRRVRWFTETDLAVADDEELLAMLAESGCVEVLIGLESATPEALDDIDRSGWKRKRAAHARENVERIQRHGIRVNGCFIVGLDAHGEEVFDDVFDFVRETRLFDVQITIPTPFPGTPMYRQLAAEGRLTHPTDWERYTLYDLNFLPKQMTATRLVEGFHDLSKRLYSSEFTRWRRAEWTI
jgi:radical SAM superfamily enzyme YgiQ (UPF0313 family)